MVSRGRSPVRPNSNESCSMVSSVENGASHRSKSYLNGDDKADGDSLSPLNVKQEPGSPGANVSSV